LQRQGRATSHGSGEDQTFSSNPFWFLAALLVDFSSLPLPPRSLEDLLLMAFPSP